MACGWKYRFRWFGLDDELILLEILASVSEELIDYASRRCKCTLKVIFIVVTMVVVAEKKLKLGGVTSDEGKAGRRDLSVVCRIDICGSERASQVTVRANRQQKV